MTYRFPNPTAWDDLPTRETMRAPHKSPHHAARFTLRSDRRKAMCGETLGGDRYPVAAWEVDA